MPLNARSSHILGTSAIAVVITASLHYNSLAAGRISRERRVAFGCEWQQLGGYGTGSFWLESVAKLPFDRVAPCGRLTTRSR